MDHPSSRITTRRVPRSDPLGARLQAEARGMRCTPSAGFARRVLASLGSAGAPRTPDAPRWLPLAAAALPILLLIVLLPWSGPAAPAVVGEVLAAEPDTPEVVVARAVPGPPPLPLSWEDVAIDPALVSTALEQPLLDEVVELGEDARMAASALLAPALEVLRRLP